ncbi:MAG: PPOX class F420-dependent oxidoreductase [Dehalococcoidia bacterium]|nr:PPOX class F420-dependent oxidoreductase [Dehalococcoidia bacterium]MCA9849752.1 PPOX class F420-dependent oxidoreductase [Dehalococcoidia bacterium]MCA9855676.1 PPOX class F420-dependent oxidoreductase [Dehalococcoidia bacterium]
MPQLPESAREMLQEKAYAHVVTRHPDGRSQITMVWADEIDGHLTFNTSRGRIKLRNIEREPQIAVTVQDPRDPQQYLVVYGRAQVVAEGGREHIDRLASRFLGTDHYPYLQPGEERVTVRVVAERVGGAGPWVSSPRG